MSEPIPESIPTATSRLSHRPTKRAKLHPSGQAISTQSHSLAVLFANADREIVIPPISQTANTTLTKKSSLPPPPEIVPNVQGSSAGAGSGEFHVYKASRRREYERLRAMDEEVIREEGEKEWEVKKGEREKKEEKRMGRNRARREKAKGRKTTAAAGKKSDSGDGGDGKKKGLGSRKGPEKNGDGEDVDLVDVQVEGKVDEIGLTIHDEDD